MFLRHLGEIMAALPGGISILWDFQECQHQCGKGRLALLESALLYLPGISLHVREPLISDDLRVPMNAWFHSPEPPMGDLSASWRNGFIGWVPQPRSGWPLPGIGLAPTDHDGCLDDCFCGILWGEITVAAPALRHLDFELLLGAAEDSQAMIERAMSIRINAGAWPKQIPFHRRKAAWRLSLTGGWEYHATGLSWGSLAKDFYGLQIKLSKALKCWIHLGVNNDFKIARILGEQAMRLGMPWRSSLRLPPAPPSFTPGISADPRIASPFLSRASYPKELAPLLSDPPVAMLRVPAVPSAEGTRMFIASLEAVPAIRWLPPSVNLPGPYFPDLPWDAPAAFPQVPESDGAQQMLFDWAEG
jgi:hypothetical protein